MGFWELGRSCGWLKAKKGGLWWLVVKLKKKKKRKKERSEKVAEGGESLGDCGRSHPAGTLVSHLDG